VFTARYALSPYIKQIHFVFKGLITWRNCAFLLSNKLDSFPNLQITISFIKTLPEGRTDDHGRLHCSRRVTVLPFYVTQCAVGLLTAWYHVTVSYLNFLLRSIPCQVAVVKNKNWRHIYVPSKHSGKHMMFIVIICSVQVFTVIDVSRTNMNLLASKG
jgi:hypothetical protein